MRVWLGAGVGLVVGVVSFALRHSVPSSDERTIVGDWSCEAKVDKAKVASSLTFLADGSTHLKYQLDAVDDGRVVKIAGENEGAWSLRGERLILTTNTQKFTSASVDGDITALLVAQSVLLRDKLPRTEGHKLIKLNADALVYHTRAGPMICSRKV